MVASQFVTQEVGTDVRSGQPAYYSGTNAAAVHARLHHFLFLSPKRLLSSSFEGRENVSDLVHSIECCEIKVGNLSGPTVHLKTVLRNSRMHYAFFDGI